MGLIENSGCRRNGQTVWRKTELGARLFALPEREREQAMRELERRVGLDRTIQRGGQSWHARRRRRQTPVFLPEDP